jgi:hypothetical protein
MGHGQQSLPLLGQDKLEIGYVVSPLTDIHPPPRHGFMDKSQFIHLHRAQEDPVRLFNPRSARERFVRGQPKGGPRYPAAPRWKTAFSRPATSATGQVPPEGKLTGNNSSNLPSEESLFLGLPPQAKKLNAPSR